MAILGVKQAGQCRSSPSHSCLYSNTSMAAQRTRYDAVNRYNTSQLKDVSLS